MSVYFYPSGALGRLTLIQGNEFWGDGTKSTPRRLPSRSDPSPPRRRNFSDFLYFRRPVDASPSIPLEARRWNFSPFPGRIRAHTTDVAPARDVDRYGIAPPTEAEVATAMQYAICNEVDNSAHQGGAAARVQGPQEGPSTQSAQRQNLAAPTEESSDLIGCCGSERFVKLGFDAKVYVFYSSIIY
ncbi:hypothetical protein M405DRAFT_576225 [Rhizopogon salebrosus TDB-379]|nr:hypothetical protein M405DRAFT_576225 [Rhizopogon salebrosus TDB-379]